MLKQVINTLRKLTELKPRIFTTEKGSIPDAIIALANDFTSSKYSFQVQIFQFSGIFP
jgi:hypothetical protein